ncbi:MAG: tRNA-intron lyase, partial [Thermoplasmata archaeon]
DRGCIVKSGFKYGAHFRVYLKDIDSHADLLVHVMNREEDWNIISRAVRVASSVKKKMVFSSIVDGKIKYVSIERIKNI